MQQAQQAQQLTIEVSPLLSPCSLPDLAGYPSSLSIPSADSEIMEFSPPLIAEASPLTLIHDEFMHNASSFMQETWSLVERHSQAVSETRLCQLAQEHLRSIELKLKQAQETTANLEDEITKHKLIMIPEYRHKGTNDKLKNDFFS